MYFFAKSVPFFCIFLHTCHKNQIRSHIIEHGNIAELQYSSKAVCGYKQETHSVLEKFP